MAEDKTNSAANDPSNPLSIAGHYNYTDRTLIDGLISAKYFVDYGFVTAVNSDKTVNVTHAIKQVMLDGTVMPDTQTSNVEVLFPQSASFGQSWTIAVGDLMMLVGFKDLVHLVASATNSSVPPVFSHYNTSNLKAIPISTKNALNPVCLFYESAGKIVLQNQSQSLMALIKSLIDEIKAINTKITNTTDVTTITAPPGGGPCYGSLTIPALAISSSDQSNLSTIESNFQQLLADS